MKKIIIHAILAILLAGAVSALGVAPAYIDVIYEPGRTVEIELTIINNEYQDLQLALAPRGELKNSVNIRDDIIYLSSKEYSKTVTYKLDMPQDLKPGERQAEILLVKVNPPQSDSLVQTSLGVVHQLRVIVPYPDQYLQGSWHLPQFNPGEDAELTLGLINLGSQQINNTGGHIIITDPQGSTIGYLETTRTSISPKDRSKITAQWDVQAKPGTYHLMAVIEYDGKALIMDKDIDVGEPLVEIKDLRTYPFKLGTIARLDIVMMNLWNQMLQEVSSAVQIRDFAENPVFNYETGTSDIGPGQTIEAPMYWDTSGIRAGNYTINVQTNYLGRVAEKSFRTIVTDNEIRVLGGTGEVVSAGRRVTGGSIIFAGILVLLVILVLALKMRPKPVLAPESRARLDEIIKTRLKQGYSRKAVKQDLVDKGWNLDLVEKEMLKLEDEQ